MITNALQNLTREELRAVAKKHGIPVGKSTSNTISNIAKAIDDKKLRFSVTVTIRPNDNPDVSFYPAATFSKKFRTHKPHKVIVAA